MKIKIAINLIFLVSGGMAWGQYGHFPLNNDFQKILVNGKTDAQYNFHSSWRPYNSDEIDSLSFFTQRLNKETDSKLVHFLLNSDTSGIQKKAIEISLNPVLLATLAQGTSNDTADQAENLGLGFRLSGYAGKKLHFGMGYLYSENTYAGYVEQVVLEKSVIPGLGEAEKKGDRYTNNYYTAYVSYAPLDFLTLEAGRGKHFIGNGYRSLLLSDNSSPYTYFKIGLQIWKIKYQVLYSGLKNVQNNVVDGITSETNKYSTTNLLSMNVGKRINIGLFQSVIWFNNQEINRGFDVNYLNPVIFMRPVEYSVGSPDNILMGLDLKYRFWKEYMVYGQLALDEFLLNEFRENKGWWGNKFGYQIGLKGNNILKINGLSFLTEFNYVRPYTYSHTEQLQNVSHYNEALTHTLGANFQELIVQLSFTRGRWLFSANTVMAEKGEDFKIFSSNYGGDIFKSNTSREGDYDNFTGQGLQTKLTYFQFKAAWLVNVDWRLMIEAGYTMRSKEYEDYGFTEENNMIHFGLKTALYNQYFDF